ncbi:monoacylglycerol lipase ABHD6 isoform X2 [Terrapene carolina triunguis]|uniref:monoacylglycerol lipase ABHD6 isoform X2 n=1 Tax=Terrapene triunguis TaxID=2587831 RepID=UPI000CEFF420|nr:monoacylglycerol lipase ABHD6 isoform X2 [Terrapene carolina triunguis]
MDLDVLNMFVIAGGTLAIPILAFVASFLLWPSALIKIYYWYWRRALGMQVRYANYDDYRFCFSYRGRPGFRPSILMLHGFSAHKDMWLSVVKFLPKNLHLVCVDMPGHEGTTRSSLDDYSINGQVKRIHQFVECIKLNRKPFHLIGTSMGGNVAGVYAAQYPAEICSLSLVCPAGLPYPTDNKFLKRLRELKESERIDRIPLIPSTPEEMADMLKLCSYVRFKVPQQKLQKASVQKCNFFTATLADSVRSVLLGVSCSCGAALLWRFIPLRDENVNGKIFSTVSLIFHRL